MSTATTTSSRPRKAPRARPSWAGGLAALAALTYAFGLSGADPSQLGLTLPALVASTLASVWLALRIRRTDGEPALLTEIELSVSVVTTAFLASAAARAAGFDAHPLVYLALALLVSFQSRPAGLAGIGIALGLEWSFQLGLGSWTAPAAAGIDWVALASRSAFIAAFGLLSVIVHGTEVLERRRKYREEVERHRVDLMRQAREFRLLSTRRNDSPSGRREAVELITRDAVDAVNHAIYVSLSLLKTGLDCHTCVLLWMDVRNEELRIKELVSDSDAIIEGVLDPAKGVIGGIARRREAVNLREVRPGFRGIPYYVEPQPIGAFMGVPVIEEGHLRGVLCVDRLDARPFEEADLRVVEETAAYIVRTVENERLFASIEKSKYELSRFFDASRRLNGVLTPEDVYEVALACARDIAPYDFAAVTVWDEHEERNVIAALSWADDYACEAQGWKGLSFAPNSGLVSMVLKNRHYLPYGGTLRDGQTVVFTPAERLEGLKSMLVLPLIVHDVPIGTFVVAHREPLRFTNERREMLEVVSNQVAVTLQNARLYEQMEQMATTDGLTGLANHRTFQKKLDETIARARRSGKTFCVVLTDIDKFKSVNDTYGHPLGDEVLRQTAKCFRANLRETDVPCRYGGEEFVLILEDTELDGAQMICDRLRTEFKKLVYHSDQGPFSCTISMGIASWPHDAGEKQDLIDLADQALYHSKESGRDRVTPYAELARRAS